MDAPFHPGVSPATSSHEAKCDHKVRRDSAESAQLGRFDPTADTITPLPTPSASPKDYSATNVLYAPVAFNATQMSQRLSRSDAITKRQPPCQRHGHPRGT